MGCSSREEIIEVFDALDCDADRLRELSFDVFTTPERLQSAPAPGTGGARLSMR